MSELLTKYRTLSPETQQQVDDFVDFMLAKQSKNSFDMKAWKEKIKSVSVWSEEDVQVFEETRKYHLIAEIMRVTDEQTLSKFETLLREYHQAFSTIEYLVTPARPTTDVDQLVKEQRYTEVDSATLDRLIDEVGVEEPIEDLLAML